MAISLARLWVVLFLLLLFGGCGEGLHPRLDSLMGTQISQQRPHPLWPPLQRIGLVVHSDTTGPGAAPSISQPFVETLSRRTEEFLNRRCRISSVVPITFPSSTQHAQIRQELIARGQEHGLSHLLLVVLSSRESSGLVTLGEERMMTQMRGISVQNMALAEVAVLGLADYVVILDLPGSATETLELLDAPIGKDQPTPEQSLEILRAQAGQQALDRSLYVLGQWCEGIPE